MQIKINLHIRLVAKLVYIWEIDEFQYSIWLLSTPVNVEKIWAKPAFTEVKYQTKNHWKDLSLSRIQKDHQYVEEMFEFLLQITTHFTLIQY